MSAVQHARAGRVLRRRYLFQTTIESENTMKVWYDKTVSKVCLDADASEAVQSTMELLGDIERMGQEADKKLCHGIAPGLTELAARLSFTPRKVRKEKTAETSAKPK